MGKNKITAKRVILNFIQINEKRYIRNHEMAEVAVFGRKELGVMYSAGTYEREFRRLKNEAPFKQYGIKSFRDVSDKFPNRKENTWEVIPYDGQEDLF